MQQNSETALSELEKSTTKCENLEKSQQAATAAAAESKEQLTKTARQYILPTDDDDDEEELSKEIELLKAQKQQLEMDLEDVRVKATALDSSLEKVKKLEAELQESLNAQQAMESQHQEALKKLYKLLVESCVKECHVILQTALDQSENLPHLTVTCSAEYLLDRTYPIYDSITNLRTAHQQYKSNEAKVHELLVSLNGFSHQLSECIIHGFATSHSAQVAAGDELINNCKKAVNESMTTLTAIEQDSEKVNENINKILEAVKKIQADAETLLPKIADVKDKEIGDMVESEMQSTTSAVDLAAERIEAMLKKTSEDNTGATLEVNTSILDACTSLMKAIKVLLEKSRDLQKEIVAQGRGASTAKEFYNKHHRWTEGLITAAKTVGWAATALVEVADKVVQGEGKFEELIVCSKQIAASTAQLVVASKVKADRESKCLGQLSNASKMVNEAAGKVVGCAKTASNAVEEKSLMDFTTLSLHQTKQQEMQTQLHSSFLPIISFLIPSQFALFKTNLFLHHGHHSFISQQVLDAVHKVDPLNTEQTTKS
ncbi:HIP1 [Acanthosepion pharaonis]|uniref:HIP1 n=1 Tax=Acanthosepion pharaonis TaxID=158019 RepID=A0A812DKA0_ACAPH|nr:HIP1 [Sepia pharaonis]